MQQRILELEPENPLNVINLASVMLSMGQLEQAEALLKEAASQSRPDSGLLQAELAQLYMNLKRYEEARSFARQAAERQPTRDHFTLLAAVCKALDDKGGLFEAISAIEQMDRARGTVAAGRSHEPNRHLPRASLPGADQHCPCPIASSRA